MLGDERLADCDAIFDAVRSDNSSSKESLELFHAAMLIRFIERVKAGEPIEPFILHFLVNAFSKALAGAVWDEAIQLPGRELSPEWGAMRPIERRDLELFCEIENRRRAGVDVTKAINDVANDSAVSYETARAAYYEWRPRLNLGE